MAIVIPLGHDRWRAARHLGRGLLCAGLLLAVTATRAMAADSTPAPNETSAKSKSTKKKTPGAKGTAKGTNKGTKGTKKASAPQDAAATAAAKHRKIGASPAYVVGDSDAHLINDQAPPITPFPEDAKAVKKAFAETRRDQLVDAEKAARDAKSPDRWRTVLFMLRGIPERTDTEACFWRVLSFYRLGEIQRARTLREGCDLPSKDSSVLNAEDVVASGIPEMGTVAVDDGFGPPGGVAGSGGKAEVKPAPPPAAAAYTGPNPTRQ
jgi:hypothetical protein